MVKPIPHVPMMAGRRLGFLQALSRLHASATSPGFRVWGMGFGVWGLGFGV